MSMQQSVAAPAVYTDLGRVMESITRRFLDVLRMELARIGVTDLSPTQALMLLHIGTEELSVRDLLERGYYLGSNASYNLKHLVEAGYVDRSPSQRDRRAARLKLSDRGLATCEALKKLEAMRADSLLRTDSDGADFETTYRTLRRLERAWTDLIRYDDADPA
ncbi:transcriptional regulator [Azospirillum sp. TSH100]|jgi:DNA-binding MarR family transcriptional regulator|uniref:MarR family transcriptional regulator n=2 Tax=Azospirillum TaxID=191 RepID=A0ABS1FE18_9PROT|nr:MarR family transcriptional regulator [Azospirillum endophyticum]MBK1841635.1 MarR family transcriptional regulator [Azospirillum endophyticum]PWC82395.1 transcriptional regulator [Azospirillum sp. TSH100]QCG88679.1 MarR family transcriptional regulator [Azospirillum sp. TSH100]